MKRSRKGFTLVELLVTIILLGVVAAVVIYNMTSVNNTSKETEYERFVSAVKSAAAVYADLNPDAFKTLYESKAFIYFTTGDLITRGLLDEEIENPYTEKRIGTDELIKANLDSSSGNLAFEYPVENNDEESFLVALSDYVVWGEPYDCMTGAGTYKLALSDEKGNLILLKDEETIKKYNFSCSLPNGFDPKQQGNYEVTYNWVTESGTKKAATRTLKVLAKVTPDIYVYDANGVQYDYTKSDKFVPTVDDTCTKWNTLHYKPMISGADTSNTEYKITQQSIYPEEGEIELVTDYTTDYTKEYEIQNGIYTYEVSTIVYGHHTKNYSYIATSTTKKTDKNGNSYDVPIQITQELVTPACLITGGQTVWTLDKTFSIKDSYAPNIDKYQYALLEEDQANVSDNSPNLRTLDTYSSFKRDGSVTVKNISLRQDKCPDVGKRSIKIFFRAINSNGYIGSWSPLVNAYLTNEVSTLITSDRGTDCNTSCANTSALGDDNLTNDINNSMYGLSCYYCNKDVYISWSGRLFNVLGLYSRTDEGKVKYDLLLANDDMIDNNTYALTTVSPGVWNINTCDGLFGASFYYSAPATDALYELLTKYVEDLPDSGKVVTQNYSMSVGTVDYSLMPTQAAYMSTAAKAQWEKWNKALSTSVEVKNTYAGIPTVEQYTNVFKKALYPTGGKTYWLGGTFNEPIHIQVKGHSDNTDIPSTHFYVAKGDGTNGKDLVSTGSSHGNEILETLNKCFYETRNKEVCKEFNKYIGKKTYIKAIMKTRNLTACNGTGTKDDPYIVSIN